jgi:two-component system response regulator FixJ
VRVKPAASEPTVFIVDDDRAVRKALSFLIESIDLQCQSFASAQEFLDSYDPNRSGCLLLDVRMPGMSGLDLQARLTAQQSTLPIIFITGHGDVPMAVEALQRGAYDFLQKPFRDQELLDRVNIALEKDQEKRNRIEEQEQLRLRYASLTDREREVMDWVVTGKANKVIAHQLGVSQRTVEIHRARVMKKMDAASLADLVRMQMLLKQEP